MISSAEKILESVQEDLRGLHYMIILKDERLTKDNLQDSLPTDLMSILVTCFLQRY